jgi:hypothetical protein
VQERYNLGKMNAAQKRRSKQKIMKLQQKHCVGEEGSKEAPRGGERERERDGGEQERVRPTDNSSGRRLSGELGEHKLGPDTSPYNIAPPPPAREQRVRARQVVA